MIEDGAEQIAEAPQPPDIKKECGMKKTISIAALASALVVAGIGAAYSQGILLDYAADRVVQKYKTSTCEQLKQAKAEGPSLKEKEAIAYLHSDDQARQSFIDKIAAPVANKMFECDMFP
jgi:hypothetical protein